MRTAVDMGLELNAIFGHFSQTRQAEDLKSTRIRQDGFIPRHELMQAPQFIHQFGTGSEHEMIRVPKNNLGPNVF